MHRPAAALTSIATLVIALAIGACTTTPTATPEPVPPTALPEPPTVDVPTEVPVIIVTATVTPTATAAPTVPMPPATAAMAPSPAAAQPTAAAPAAVATAAPPTAAPPTANSGAPVVEFYPDNGQFQIDKDQLCIAVNWRTENVTDVRLEVGGGKAASVAASGRQADICFGEDKLKLRLIYKLKDGREESQSIEITRKD